MKVPLEPLRCLLVEDSEDDARLVLRTLRNSGYAVTSERVDTSDAMRAALERSPWDVVISDYNLPHFNGGAALALVKATGQDLPFIVVSGTIGEELAVETMRAGAHDYVMKDRLARLGPAVARELAEAAKRQAHRRANEHLHLQSAALAAAGNAIVITDCQALIQWVNPAFTALSGYSLAEAVGRNLHTLVKSGRHEESFYQELWATILARRTWDGELINRRKDGTLYWEKQTISPVCRPDGTITHFIAIKRDLTERKLAEEAQRENEMRSARQRDAIIHLAGAGANEEQDLSAALRSITETGARTMGVSRASIWLFNSARTAIRCVDLYESATGRHIAGMELAAVDYPAYFQALDRMNVVAVEDPRQDPRTREFTEHYLVPLEITAMLDAGVHIHGVVAGVLCHERTGVPRHWKPDEHAFAAALANLASLALIESQRRAAEESQRATEQKLRMIIEHSTQLFYTHSPDNVLTYVSPQAREMFDCEPSEAMRCWMEFLTDHPENAVGIARSQAAIDTGRPQPPYALELKTKLGRKFWVEVRESPVVIDGRTVAIAGALTDITERKRAETALQESESRYRLVFDRNPLPMWVYDSTTLAILAANEAAIRNYGYSAEQYRTLTYRELHAPEVVPALLTQLGRSGPDGVDRFETRHRKQDGTIIHTEVFSRPLTHGGQHAHLAMAADITEKKTVQEKFLRAQRLESLGMLAAGIAHDLNNVLSPIMFAAPLLRSSLTEPREIKILDTLAQCATRGAGLVKQILSFAGATSGGFQTLQIKYLARDVVGVIEETFPKSITLNSQIPPDLWPVRGDATQIHQVLMNLCVNARDAMPQGGTLTVAVANRVLDVREAAAIPGAHPGRWLQLEVSDTGSGIPPEVLARIWDAFFTTKAAGKGTGLGLSTVRGIAASHHGFVTVDTEVGVGTTFRVYLPAAENEEPVTRTTTPSAVPHGTGQQILVVDDDHAIRFITAEILAAHGYRVMTAADGFEAITLFSVQPGDFALVVTDVDMPRLGGVVLVQTLRKIRPDIPLLAISGLTRDDSVEADVNLIQKLVPAFLGKPFKQEALLSAVHQALTATPPSTP